MANLPGLNTYLINLDRSPERLAAMRARLDALSLLWQRVTAVEGKLLDLANDPRVDEPGYRLRHGKPLNPSEVGCYMSHLAVYDLFLSDSNFEVALVLEDDCDFAPDFPDVLQALLLSAGQWDLVRLSGVHRGTPVGRRPLCAGRNLAIMLTQQTNSAAYLINRKAAQALRLGLVPMQLPLDHAFDRPWLYGIRARMVDPLPTRFDETQPSTIGYGHQKYKKDPWHRRWGTYRHRVLNELARIRYALREWLALR